MGIVELFLIAVGLSMDAFAVSVCKGLSTRQLKPKHYLIIGAWFGGFQALMPTIGYLLGSTFEKYITRYDHWVAFVLLSFIGGASFDDTRNEKYQVIEYVINACGIKDKTAAVMVGDRFHDIEGAKFNGISTVGVLYGFGNRKELENAGADAIAESVSALESILL